MSKWGELKKRATIESIKDIEDLEGFSGVYCFETLTDVLYIGSSVNLRKRIKSSSVTNLINLYEDIYITIYICENRSTARKLEFMMIQLIGTKINKNHNLGTWRPLIMFKNLGWVDVHVRRKHFLKYIGK